jgi:hypothetical protein
MRIVMRYPTLKWDQVWINLHTTLASDNIKTTWFIVINVILPTNEHLHWINLTETRDLKCAVSRIRDYNAWLNVKGEKILGRDKNEAGTDPAYEPGSHRARLGFEATVYCMVSQRHGAVLWALAHMMWFLMRERPTLSA